MVVSTSGHRAGLLAITLALLLWAAKSRPRPPPNPTILAGTHPPAGPIMTPSTLQR
jgi:hypothetical protein